MEEELQLIMGLSRRNRQLVEQNKGAIQTYSTLHSRSDALQDAAVVLVLCGQPGGIQERFKCDRLL